MNALIPRQAVGVAVIRIKRRLRLGGRIEHIRVLDGLLATQRQLQLLLIVGVEHILDQASDGSQFVGRTVETKFNFDRHVRSSVLTTGAGCS